MDGRKNNGGSRLNAGRKKKVEEEKLIEKLDNIIDNEKVIEKLGELIMKH